MSRHNPRPTTTSQKNLDAWSVRPGERCVVWTIWMTYGAFYFCRTNLSAAVPGMGMSPAEGGLGLSGTEIGAILASLKLSYAFGQLLNGQLSERFSPRLLLTFGMFGSAALNVLFGLGAGFYFLLFVWAVNGYCQSLGWTPSVRVVGNWVPVIRRGFALGIIGTGYQITLGATYLVSSQAAQRFGWRGALFAPSILLAAAGVVMLLLLRESPDDGADSDTHSSHSPARQRLPFLDVVVLTLSNPTLWMLGISLGLLNACRYGFLDWGISHLIEVQQSSVGKAGLKYVVLAIGAASGSYLAGWATDRFFGSRRAPVICGLLVLLSILTISYEYVADVSEAATVGLLVLIGFCIYGPQVLLVGTAPADLARKGTSAAAAGFVNFQGYLGASIGDVITGYFKDEAHGGWQVAIYIWAGWALLAAVFAALLWNATAHKDESHVR